MRKNIFGRRLKRDINERKALFKGLMSSLVLHGKIKTTEAKAKAIKGKIEKLVTKVKKRGNDASRFLMKYLTKEAISKIINDIGPRFQEKKGGYTRIIKLGERLSDNARIAILEWVEGEVVKEKPATSGPRNETKTQKPMSLVDARETSAKKKNLKKRIEAGKTKNK